MWSGLRGTGEGLGELEKVKSMWSRLRGTGEG